MPTNANLNATLSALRYLLVVLGGILAQQGLSQTPEYKYVMLASGSIMIIGPAVWGVWAALVNWHRATAVGVQAGINLTVSGHALDTNGAVVGANDGTTPPLPVTLATAAKIVTDFGPSPASISKA